MSHSKRLRSFICAASVMALFSFPAKAELYSFTYAFSGGTVATGSFTGITNGLFVENISDASVSINGITLSGSPDLTFRRPELLSSPAVISFDGRLNDFEFVNVWYPFPNHGGAAANLDFFAYSNHLPGTPLTPIRAPMVSTWASSFTSPAPPSAWDISNDNGIDLAARWSLINVTTPVPEPETYAMMLAGLGVLGFMTLGRQQKAA